MHLIKRAMGVAVCVMALGAYSAVFDARTFGAKGDGTTKDTSAIQAAIDAASAAGGGEVRLSAGTYVSGSIFLKSNVDFHLEAGAVLLGSPDKDDYNAADICPQNYAYRPESSSGAHLILCIEQKNVTVRGPGKIDGNSAGFLVDPTTGHEWGYVPGAQSAGQGRIPWRPSQMLYFVESQEIRVQDLELANSTYWTLFLHGCERVKIRGLDIHNERDRFHTCNGDGIDIDCCQRVSISDCSIRTADDCITLRADGVRLKTNRDCAYVTVENCTLSSKCNCVRLGVGSGRVHDAVFSNVVVHDARTAVNFVSSWDPSAAKGVDFWNVRFMNWVVDCKQLLRFSCGAVATGVVRQAELRDISFSGFTGRASETSELFGLPSAPVRNVLFRDVDVPAVLQVKCAENVRIEGGALACSDVRETNVPGGSCKKGLVTVAGIAGDGTTPCSEAIQRLIDANPNREIFFPDGTYLLDKPVCTPADPKRSVCLRLSAYARFTVIAGWTNAEAMVRLGAIHPANDIRTPGSWYWLKGGIIDGGGRADGVSIDGGRETLIADVSMKHVRIGLRIKRGANSGSSDCDIRNVNIVGNGAADSVGVLIEGCDNTLQNMRIAGVVRGVVIRGGGNCLRDIHPLFTGNWDFYDQSVGFDIDASDVWGDFCYSDQFATAFRFGERARGGTYDKCFVFWYASGKGRKHVAFESVGPFVAHVNDPTVSFKSSEGRNAFLKVGKPGGGGFIRKPHCNFNLVNDPESIRDPYIRD